MCGWEQGLVKEGQPSHRNCREGRGQRSADRVQDLTFPPLEPRSSTSEEDEQGSLRDAEPVSPGVLFQDGPLADPLGSNMFSQCWGGVGQVRLEEASSAVPYSDSTVTRGVGGPCRKPWGFSSRPRGVQSGCQGSP